MTIDVKKLTPRIKNVKNVFFMKKNKKNVKKRWIKNVLDKLTKLIKPNEKFQSKITVLICMTTFQVYCFFVRELFIADMLHSSLKSGFMQDFSRFSRILAGLVG